MDVIIVKREYIVIYESFGVWLLDGFDNCEKREYIVIYASGLLNGCDNCEKREYIVIHGSCGV